jgi:hypothetical protein
VGLGRGGLDGDFFGNGEVVGLGIFPVDQPDCSAVLADPGRDFDAIAQELINGVIAVVEALAGVVGDLVEFGQGAVDERGGVARLQEGAQQERFEVAIVGAIGPVTEIRFSTSSADNAPCRSKSACCCVQR